MAIAHMDNILGLSLRLDMDREVVLNTLNTVVCVQVLVEGELEYGRRSLSEWHVS